MRSVSFSASSPPFLRSRGARVRDTWCISRDYEGGEQMGKLTTCDYGLEFYFAAGSVALLGALLFLFLFATTGQPVR